MTKKSKNQVETGIWNGDFLKYKEQSCNNSITAEEFTIDTQ